MVQGSLPGTLNPNPVRETKGLGFGLPPPPNTKPKESTKQIQKQVLWQSPTSWKYLIRDTFERVVYKNSIGFRV